MGTATKILLVDDHALVRSGLRSLLEHEEGFCVIGEASTGRQAVEMVKRLGPDVVVMDVCMPDLNGCDAAQQSIAARPDVKVVALSAQYDDKTAAAMVKAGAVGFVKKESAFEDLVKAIRTVISNKVYLDPRVVSRVAANRETGGDSGAYSTLSAREREVLQLISEGKSTKEIARHLGVSLKTAETHRRNIMEKLSIDNVAELTKYAIREGLTTA